MGQLVATFVVSMSGERLNIVLDDLDSDPPNPLLAAVLGAVRAAMPLITPVDFAPVFTTLDISTPQTSRIDLVNGVAALRFDAVGPVSNHLLPEQDWATFVGGDDIEEFVGDQLSGFDAAGRTRVAGRFSGPIGHLTADAGWGLAQTADRTYVFKVGRS